MFVFTSLILGGGDDPSGEFPLPDVPASPVPDPQGGGAEVTERLRGPQCHLTGPGAGSVSQFSDGEAPGGEPVRCWAWGPAQGHADLFCVVHVSAWNIYKELFDFYVSS